MNELFLIKESFRRILQDSIPKESVARHARLNSLLPRFPRVRNRGNIARISREAGEGAALVEGIVNLSTEDLWDAIYKGFNSNVCNDCHKQAILSRDMSNPQPIPYVGPEFGKDQYSLLFCGIETYFNEKRKDCASVKYDRFPTSQVESLYFEKEPEKNNYSPFWKWVRRISEEVLRLEPSDTFKHIAYSNLIKCQSRRKGGDFFSSSYELSNELPINCIKRAGWIYCEIEKIEAKNVILFAGRAKEFYLARLFLDDMEGKMIRKFDYSNYDLPEKILKKRKDRDLFIHLRDGTRRFILTNHPQGTPHEIRDEIVRIVGENDWTGSMEWKMPKNSSYLGVARAFFGAD